MINNAILEFLDDPQPVEVDDLFTYSGDKDYRDLIALEAKVDTRELTLSFLGDVFPGIRKLRLNNSIIPSVRDIGCTLVNLRFLSLARCNLSSLDGISTLSPNLEEIYLAFNFVTDVCDLMGMENLRILDLEDNKIESLEALELLSLCPKLKALTMAGNPAALSCPDYRQRVSGLIPHLVYLDEKRIKPKSPKSPSRPLPPAPEPVRAAEIGVQNVAPLDLSKLDDDEVVMTEMVYDKVGERPPTARGGPEERSFAGFFKSSPQNSNARMSSGSQNRPRIIRPMSAKGRAVPH